MRIVLKLPSSTISYFAIYPSFRRISAIAIFILDAGTSTVSCFAVFALRILVSISAIGSLIVIWIVLLFYQLAFLTPGISPLYASSRKHTRQIPYFLKYACGRPQILQRLYSLVENFCLRCCFSFIAVFAMKISSLLCEWHVELC